MKNHNFTLFSGNSFIIPLDFTNKDTGAFINLTGTLTKFTMRESVNGVSVFTKTATIINASEGSAKVELSNTETATLSPKQYEYDIVFSDASGVVTTILYGKIEVKKSITRND